MIEFYLRTAVTILLISLVTGPMGSLAIWKRMGMLADAMSHAALLGVAFALAWGVSPLLGAAVIAVLIGIYLGSVDARVSGIDAHLALIAYGGLSLALLVTSWARISLGLLEGFLFGDLLSVSWDVIGQMFVLILAILAVLAWRWNKQILVTVNSELAAASGINVGFEHRLFIVLLALTIAIAANAVGVLLVGALLIIPAMTARLFARSPEAMVVGATLVGAGAGIGGLAFSVGFNSHAGPSIVVTAIALYLCCHVFFTRIRKN